jgi:hypothetical protein
MILLYVMAFTLVLLEIIDVLDPSPAMVQTTVYASAQKPRPPRPAGRARRMPVRPTTNVRMGFA